MMTEIHPTTGELDIGNLGRGGDVFVNKLFSSLKTRIFR